MNKYQELYFNRMSRLEWESSFVNMKTTMTICGSQVIANQLGCSVHEVKAKRRKMLSEVMA